VTAVLPGLEELLSPGMEGVAAQSNSLQLLDVAKIGAQVASKMLESTPCLCVMRQSLHSAALPFHPCPARCLAAHGWLGQGSRRESQCAVWVS